MKFKMEIDFQTKLMLLSFFVLLAILGVNEYFVILEEFVKLLCPSCIGLT